MGFIQRLTGVVREHRAARRRHARRAARERLFPSLGIARLEERVVLSVTAGFDAVTPDQFNVEISGDDSATIARVDDGGTEKIRVTDGLGDVVAEVDAALVASIQVTGSDDAQAVDLLLGTDAVDVAEVSAGEVTLNGLTTTFTGIERIAIRTGDGDDAFTVDSTGGLPPEILLDGGTDSSGDRVTFFGTTGDDDFLLTGNTVAHARTIFSLEGVEIVTVDATQGGNDAVTVRQDFEPSASGGPAGITLLSDGVGDELSVESVGSNDQHATVAGDEIRMLEQDGPPRDLRVTHDGFSDIAVKTGDGDDDVLVEGLAASFNGSLTVETGAGDDTLTLDFSAGGEVPHTIDYLAGGNAGDRLVAEDIGVPELTITHRFENATDGRSTVEHNADAFSPIELRYTGVAAIDDLLEVDDRVFEFTAGSETIALDDDPDAIAGRMTIGSTLAVGVTFAVPNQSLAIFTEEHGGSGDDVIEIFGLDPTFAATLEIEAGDGDLVKVAGPIAILGTGRLLVAAEDIVVEHAVTTNTGEIALDATRDLLVDAAIATSGGNVELQADRDIRGTSNASLASHGGEIAIVAETAIGGGFGTIDWAGTIDPGSGRLAFGLEADNGEISGVISGSGEVEKLGTGALAFTADNLYTGPTNVVAGTLLIDGSTATQSDFAVSTGATLGGNGTIGGNVAILGGTLAPGSSPGALTADGEVELDADSTFIVEIDGNAPGLDGYDQLIASSVSLGGAALELHFDTAAAGFLPAAGESYIIIRNDGGDPVSGQFDGYDEGAIVGTDFGGSGLVARITYAGGDGNDVAIVVDGPFSHTAPADGSETEYVIRRVGGNIRLLEDGAVFDSRPIQGVTDYTLIGEDGFRDMLDIQTSGFDHDFTGTIAFHGGDGGPDDLRLSDPASDQTFEEVAHDFFDAHSGRITLDADGAAGAGLPFIIEYHGLEPISQTITAAHVTLNYASTSETITVSDSGDPGETTVIATASGVPTAEMVTFANPTDSLTINAGGGNDAVVISGFGSGFDAALIVNGDDGNDSITLNSAVALGGTNSVSFTAETIRVNAPIVTDTGDVSLLATDLLALASAGDITTNRGDVTLSATDGAIAMQTGTVVNGDADGAASTGGAITVLAGTTIALGRVTTDDTAAAIDIDIQAGGAITDVNGGANNVAAPVASIVGGSIGSLGLFGNRIETAVDTLFAAATTGQLAIDQTGDVTATLTAENGTARLDVAGNLVTGGDWSANAFDINGAGDVDVLHGVTADTAAGIDIVTSGGVISLGAGAVLDTSSADGTIQLRSHDLVIDTSVDPAAIDAGSGNVLLQPNIGRTIDLGIAAGGSGQYDVNDAEADRITARILEVGTLLAGDVRVGDLSLDPARVGTLVILTAGDVREHAPDAAADITVNDLAIISGDGVDLDVDVTGTLAVFDASSQGVSITDVSGGLTIGAVPVVTTTISGVTTFGGDVRIETQSPDGDLLLERAITTRGGDVELLSSRDVTSAPLGTIATTPLALTGGDGGTVSIAAGSTGQIDLAGTIVTTGATSFIGSAGDGGDVTIETIDGAIRIAAVTASGGAGIGPFAQGGDAGDIDITSGGGVGDRLTLAGTLTALGGTGAVTGVHGTVGLVAADDVRDDHPGLDVAAGRLNVLAANGVATLPNPLDTRVDVLDVRNTTSGDVAILEQDALTVVHLHQDAPDGNAFVRTLAGSLTIGTIPGGPGVSAHDGLVTLHAAERIIDGDDLELDIVANNVELIAGTGIAAGAGVDARLEVDAADLAAFTDSGHIRIRDMADGLTIAALGGTDGVTIAGIGPGGANIEIGAASPLTIDAPVTNASGGAILLAADGATAADILEINADVRATNGNGTIDLLAGGDVRIAAGASVTAAGSGDVTVLAGTAFNDGGPITPGDAGARVVMGTGSRIAGDDGDIELRAPDDIELALLDANRDGDAALGDVTVVANADGLGGGAILDANGAANNVNADLALLAGTSIGTPADAIETSVRTLLATAAAGDLNIAQTGDVTATLTADLGDARFTVAGHLVMGGAWSANAFDVTVAGDARLDHAITTDGAGGIDLRTTAGGTIDANAPLAATATGPVRLTAAADLHLRALLRNLSGDVALRSGGTTTFSAAGDIKSDAGTVSVIAGGSIVQAAGSVIDADALGAGGTGGPIVVDAGGSFTLGRLATDRGVSIAAGTFIRQAGANGVNDIAAASLLFRAGAGIGTSASPLDIAVERVEGRGGTGGVHFVNTGTLVIGGVDAAVSGVTSTGGGVGITTHGAMTLLERVADTGGGTVRLRTTTGDIASFAPILAAGGSGHVVLDSARDIRIHDSGANPDVANFGAGDVSIRAARNVSLIGNVQILTQAAGTASTATSIPPRIVASAAVVPQIDILGRTSLTVPVGSPGERNLKVTIDWGDGRPPDVYRVDAGTHTFTKTYLAIDAINRPNPADPFVIRYVVEYDDSIGILSNGGAIDWTISFASAIAEQPGEGLQVIFMPFESEAPLLVFVREEGSGIGHFDEGLSVEEVIASEFGAAAADVSAFTGQRFVLRVLEPDGTVRDFPLPDDILDADRFPSLFSKLPENRYRIVLVDQDGIERVVMDVLVRKGRPVDPTSAEQGGQERPRLVQPQPDPADTGDDGSPDESNADEPNGDAAARDDDGVRRIISARVSLPDDGESELAAATDGAESSSPWNRRTAVIVGATLALHAARTDWRREVDEAFEKYGDRSLRKGARLGRRLRRAATESRAASIARGARSTE
ncbi:MAG: autotransporter-associated beta strand repeat-containing protein [Planctomycetaceae bacterium]